MVDARAPVGSPDALIGTDAGAYRLIRRIGVGAMGRVYEAVSGQGGAHVAVKLLNRELAQDAVFLERFRREALVTARFTNPHVVQVREFGQLAQGVPFMVMELLEGEDLETRLARVGRLTIGEGLDLVRALSVALTEAHQSGVIHRDLKPANIFYARTGAGERIKLLDFGLAKALRLDTGALTQSGQLVGTVWYMSPEQGRGAELTPASDLYSLAVVLFQALSGALPYQAGSPHEYLYALASSEPRLLTQVAPELPLALESVLGRALARDPSRRPASVAALGRELVDVFSMGDGATHVGRPTARPRALVSPRASPPLEGEFSATVQGLPAFDEPEDESDPTAKPASRPAPVRPPAIELAQRRPSSPAVPKLAPVEPSELSDSQSTAPPAVEAVDAPAERRPPAFRVGLNRDFVLGAATAILVVVLAALIVRLFVT